MRSTQKPSPPPAFIQSICSASSTSVPIAGRVVRLVLEAVVERRREVQEVGDPAAGRLDLGDPLLRRGAQQREPQPAVGGERLLRREVVDVGLRGVERQPARAGGRVDQDQRIAGPGWTRHRKHHSGRRLVVRPRVDVGVRVGHRLGRRAGLGPHDDRVAEERSGLRRLRELGGELAEGEVMGALAHQAERRRVPERRRPAVAERDRVAVRKVEQLGETARARARRAP